MTTYPDSYPAHVTVRVTPSQLLDTQEDYLSLMSECINSIDGIHCEPSCMFRFNMYPKTKGHNYYFAYVTVTVSPSQSGLDDPLAFMSEYINDIDGLHCEGWREF